MKIYLGAATTAKTYLLLKNGNWCLSYHEYTKSPNSIMKILNGSNAHLFIDSGAFTICNKLFTEMKDTSYLKTREFKQYLEEYVKFLHKYKDRFDFYATWDVIHNPRETREIQKYMESCGLEPIPVFHYPEHISWLKKYVDNYRFIGLSDGMGKNITTDFLKALNQKYAPLLFRDSDMKVHAFGITDVDVLSKYPWYSSDSTSWNLMGINGSILIPEYKDGSYNFLKHRNIKVSEVHTLTPGEIEQLKQWLIYCGVGSSENKFTSCCSPDDILTPYSPLEIDKIRCHVNYHYYRGLEEQLTREGR